MANHVGTQLSRLLKERVYLSGNAERIEAEISKLQAQIDEKHSALQQEVARIRELDEAIAELSDIDPNDLKSMQARPRDIKVRHGSIRNELVKLLRDSGKVWRTGELVVALAAKLGFPAETPKDKRRMQERVRRPMNLWCKEGYVKRLPDCPETGQGVWQWIGPTLDQAAE